MDYYLLCLYSRLTHYLWSGSLWLPLVASQRFQTLVPSVAPVELLCGGLSTRFLYDLGLKRYHPIKYNELTVLLYYPIAPRASPVIVSPESALCILAEVPGPPLRRDSGPTCGRSLNCTPPLQVVGPASCLTI